MRGPSWNVDGPRFHQLFKRRLCWGNGFAQQIDKRRRAPEADGQTVVAIDLDNCQGEQNYLLARRNALSRE